MQVGGKKPYLVVVFSVIHISQNGTEHAHAFIYSPEACRFCDVEQDLNGKIHTYGCKTRCKPFLGGKRHFCWIEDVSSSIYENNIDQEDHQVSATCSFFPCTRSIYFES